MMRMFLAATATIAFAPATLAEGDPTVRAERLDTLVLDSDEGFSIDRYVLASGVYYRWRIQSDGLEEYKVLAPSLFRESWIDQVVVEDREVKPMGLHAVEFDDAGEIDIWFIPIRPGIYEFYVEGLEDLGFRGTIEVR